MVPSHFKLNNAKKILKLLETSLKLTGMFLYAIGIPLYLLGYRSINLTSKVVKKTLFYVEKHLKFLIQNLPQFELFIKYSQKKIRTLSVSYFEKSKQFLLDTQARTVNKTNDFRKYAENLKSKMKRIRIGYYQNIIKNSLIRSMNSTFFLSKKKILIKYLKQQLRTISNKSTVAANVIALSYRQIIEDSTQLTSLLQVKLALISNTIKKEKNIYIKKAIKSYKRRDVFYSDLNKTLTKFMRTSLGILINLLTPFSWIFSNKNKIVGYGISVALFGLFITAALSLFTTIEDLPSAEVLAAREIKASTKIYDRNGILLYKIYKDENRTPVDLSEIPTHVIDATLAIEDSEFYSHPGFSIKGMARAALRNYQKGELTGGSTITQQLVKNTLLSPEKTISRKVKELFLAVDVEMNYTKEEILEMYLNEVSYGGTAYGIQEAAKMYFDKDVKELTLAEAALLAGLPKSPTDYSPFGPHPKASIERRLEVLRLMHENEFITSEERLQAQQEKLTFATNTIDIKAPHFVMYIREQLENKYGKEMVEQGGLEVHTTLDYETQLMAEKMVREEVETLSYLNVGNGAAVVMSPSSGEILAMVGSRDYFDYENDGNVNVTTSLRQPGSSIKLINYAYALSNGMTAATIIDDSPTSFLVEGQPPYQPKNYDGRYRGRISLRSAFAESRNIPAVKVLNKMGVENMISLGKQMGINTWEDRNRFGLSLTLGGGEVKLIELAQAYATVANYGRKPQLTSVLEIKDHKGNVLESNECQPEEKPILIALADKLSADAHASESAGILPIIGNNCEGERILDPRVAYILTDILKDNQARTPAFGSRSLLNITDHPEVAVKTGTSNDLRDNLTIGYNQNYLVAVWVGNNDNSPMSRVASGITGASPIFNKIMTALTADDQSREWIVPPGLEKVEICRFTGTLPCDGCPTVSEWFLKNNVPERHCSKDWFQEQKDRDDDKPRNQDSRNLIPEWIREEINN